MQISDNRAIPQMACKIDTTNLCAYVGLFASLQKVKVLKELLKMHVTLPHTSLKFKLSGTVATRAWLYHST